MIGKDELIKCGRLNLVDLAGSENISRTGVREVWNLHKAVIYLLMKQQ